MSFAMPVEIEDTVATLRELEQNAPRQTSREIRTAMIQAAKELEDWQNLAADCIRRLDEAMALRVGQMDSDSRAHEVQRQVKATMSDITARLRELV
jgi:hypothetical protein